MCHEECWSDQNDKFHDPAKQRQCALDWLKATEELILRLNKVDAIRCVRNQVFNAKNKTIKTIQVKNRYFLEACKKLSERNDCASIRFFFNMRLKRED